MLLSAKIFLISQNFTQMRGGLNPPVNLPAKKESKTEEIRKKKTPSTRKNRRTFLKREWKTTLEKYHARTNVIDPLEPLDPLVPLEFTPHTV